MLAEKAEPSETKRLYVSVLLLPWCHSLCISLDSVYLRVSRSRWFVLPNERGAGHRGSRRWIRSWRWATARWLRATSWLRRSERLEDGWKMSWVGGTVFVWRMWLGDWVFGLGWVVPLVAVLGQRDRKATRKAPLCA